MRWLYKFFFFRLAGWKISGKLPGEKKYLIIVAPHSSNIDFFLGLAVRSILKFKASFLGKKELFRFPFGSLFRKLGGYPVDRSKNTNLVDAVAAIFDAHEKFILAIAPEGTRKYVAQWKTGFYFIALKAKVPVVMASFDYHDKTVYISEPLFPSGDFESDFKIITGFFHPRKGKTEKMWPEVFYESK